MDIQKKIDVYKNKANRLKIKLSGVKKYQTYIIKAIVLDASGKLNIHDMIASIKYSGFAYQINEVWREINPESKIKYMGHDAYFYIGNCMLPLKFDSHSFMPEENLKIVKRKTINKEGEIIYKNGTEGNKIKKGRGYYFVEPMNFKRILEAKILGELTMREQSVMEKNKFLIIMAVILGVLYLILKSQGIDVLAG